MIQRSFLSEAVFMKGNEVGIEDIDVECNELTR